MSKKRKVLPSASSLWKKYNLNCVTHLTSGNNVVEYEYDHKSHANCGTIKNTIYIMRSIRRAQAAQALR